MPFNIIRNDITKVAVDAIVNAANTDLKMGGGVCGAIFNAAGKNKLQDSCNKLAPIKTGDAVITPGFGISAKYIIHTAGPIYNDGKQGESEMLKASYTNSLKLALENDCKSVAFPLISTGIYGYPKAEALKIATTAIKDFLENHEMDILLVVFDKEALEVSEKLLGEVSSYINDKYVEEHVDPRRKLLKVESESLEYSNVALYNSMPAYEFEGTLEEPSNRLENLVKNLDEPFSAALLRLIDSKGKTDVEVYKRANIDRKLFSKIRTGKGYMPSKRTAIALAVALKLNLEETDDLLERAGYALSPRQKFDVIVDYFNVSGRYDIFEINEVLFKYNEPLLGG